MLILPKRLVFVDVGAYEGDVSKKYCEFIQVEPRRFYLVEPNPISFKKLEANMPGYNLYNLAISDHDGKETLYYDDRFLNASSLYREMAEGKGGEVQETPVQCLTMDSFMRLIDVEHIDFLKVNCEGGEFRLFDAPTLDFLDHVTYLLISWHGKRDIFNNDEAAERKQAFNKLLLKNDFRFLDGVKPDVIGQRGVRTHEMQFWKKDF